ncbi:MAG: hypothetical protein ACLRWP_02935 [Bilophila wadsworthia]
MLRGSRHRHGGLLRPHLTEITTRMRYIDDVTPAAKFFAAATVLLVLEITRRTTGWALVIVASTLILYASSETCCPAPSSIRASPSTSSSNIFSCSMKACTASRSAWRRRPCSGSSCSGRSSNAPR